jgi:hypothetical protein
VPWGVPDLLKLLFISKEIKLDKAPLFFSKEYA